MHLKNLVIKDVQNIIPTLVEGAEMASGDRARHEPQFVSGAKPASQAPATEESFDYLKSYKLPKSELGMLWYNLRKALSAEVKTRHENYLKLRAYEAELERARQEHAQVVFDARTEHLIDRLRYLDNLGIRPIMAFCNVKSAGKTTSLLQVLSVIAEHTRRSVVAIPATQNIATSTLALMAGVDSPNAITVGELSRRIDELNTFRSLDTRISMTRNGVGIVSENQNNVVSMNDQYTLEKFVELLMKVLPNVGYIGLDLGNDDINNDSIAVAAVRFAHVLNFSYLYGKAVPTTSLRRTVDGYNTDTQMDQAHYQLANPADAILTGIGIPTVEKVSRSIVIANLAPLDKEINFDELMEPKQAGLSNPLPTWRGRGFNVPYDPYLDNADESGVVKPANLDHVTDVTHQQALEIAVANLEEAARVQGISTEGAPEFTPPPVREPEHPFPSMLESK
jgi:hypothetical protein